MKQFIFILFITVFINAYAENIEDDDRCIRSGDVIKLGKEIQKALKTNDMALLAEQFSYPFSVNIGQKGKRIISSKQELIDNFPLIFSKAEIERMIAEKNLISFIKCDEVSILHGSMWFSKDKKDIKIFVINAPETTKLSFNKPYGQAVMSVTDLKLLKEFAYMYDHSNDNIKVYKSLKVDSGNNESTPRLVGYSDSRYPSESELLLYRVDINNDNEPEWILVFTCSGTICASGIEGVYKTRGQVLEVVGESITSRFFLDLGIWTSDPFLTIHEGKVIFNFFDRKPTQVCSYLWQNNKVTLVHGTFLHGAKCGIIK
jgi:hypothetical protein